MADAVLRVDGREVRVSSLELVLFPKTGFTKAQVIEYYIQISPILLPHLRNRPLTLKRFLNGVTERPEYERNAPSHRPRWVRTAAVPRRGGGAPIQYVLANNLPTLVWLAHLRSLEVHVFLAQAPKIRRPTHVIFDLDPGDGASVLDCAQAALWFRDALEELGLKSFIKSSGSKGLHLYVPLNTPVTYALSSAFARSMAEQIAARHPDQLVSTMEKSSRQGRVFIDWQQNVDYKTSIAPYSLRARPDGPFVAAPFTWPEVRRGLSKAAPEFFFPSPEWVLRRVQQHGDVFAAGLTLKQHLKPECVRAHVVA